MVYTENLKQLTLNELYRVYANEVDAMQGMSNIVFSEGRTLSLSKLILINNEIRERENESN
jgi:hypothetical protein